MLSPPVDLAAQQLLNTLKQGSADNRLMHAGKRLARFLNEDGSGIETVVQDFRHAVSGYLAAVLAPQA